MKKSIVLTFLDGENELKSFSEERINIRYLVLNTSTVNLIHFRDQSVGNTITVRIIPHLDQKSIYRLVLSASISIFPE